ncbi:MAG: DJ-1/PfpI family protein [Candidatus Aminicenantes bacterium]|nr:DJ-1/PfpI family protein [Candidatus Aminicenantes bacterium]
MSSNIRKNIFPCIMIFLILSLYSLDSSRTKKNVLKINENPRILILAAKNTGLNYFLSEADFKRAGVDLYMSGVVSPIEPCPPLKQLFKLKPFKADFQTKDIDDIRDFHGIFIPPGSGDYNPVKNPFADITEDPASLNLLSSASSSGIPIFAVCAGTRVLAAAGIVQGKTVICSPKFKPELEAAGANVLDKFDYPSPVSDNGVLTSSQGLNFHYVNSELLLSEMEKRLSPSGKPKPDTAFETRPFSHESLEWGFTYGASSSEGGRAAVEGPDGGILIVGYTFSRGNGNADLLLLKASSKGRLLWNRSFGGQGFEYGNACCLVEDGIIAAGYTTSSSREGRDVYLLKTDFDGKMVWEKTFGGPADDVGTSVFPLEDGAVVCGHTSSSGAGAEDIYLLRVNSEGGKIWERTFGGEYPDIGISVAVSKKNEIFLAGTIGFTEKNTEETKTPGKSKLKYRNLYKIFKLDTSGNMIWENTYENERKKGYGFNETRGMTLTADGGAALVGLTDIVSVASIDLIKADAEGKKATWSKCFEETDFYNFGNSIIEIGANHFLIGGAYQRVNEACDILLAEVSYGFVLRKWRIGGSKTDWASDIVPIRDGGTVIAGQTDSYGCGSFDVFLMKIK